MPRGRQSRPGALRRAQLAAAFAVTAHFAVADEPAIVSMPTGTGKTAVMTLVPYLLPARRVLVVTPTKLLRAQLAREFSSMAVLRRTRVMPNETLGPRTAEVSVRMSNQTRWLSHLGDDVVVGTPNVLSPSSNNVADPPPDLFDLLIFDEAHHTPAATYQALLAAFPGALAMLLTATAFRRDRKDLPGTSVFTYSLRQALEEGVLAPVTFVPVDVPADSDARAKDVALAKTARSRMDDPIHVSADSRIIARTSSVAHAGELVDIYQREGLRLGQITAQTTTTELRQILAAAREGDLAGFISVGVLGEGFDFPTLKIGVYHRRHASLPATLQFLGRIARVVPSQANGELLAVREEVSDETRELYADDASWATLVPQLADAATDKEAARRAYIRSFEPTPQDPLSLAAIRPRKDVQVFVVPSGLSLDLDASVQFLNGGEVIYHGVDGDGELAVVITEHLERPEWLDADTLDRFRYELFVVFHDRQRDLMFVHGGPDAVILELLDVIGYSDPLLVDPLWLDRLMNSVAIAGYHSVGMRSARAPGGRLAAYRMMAGTSVGTAVLPSETRSYGTGHAIARVRDPMTVSATSPVTQQLAGSITSLGVSYGRGKVFSPDLAQLLEWRRWCERLGLLVHEQRQLRPSGPPALALLSPRRLAEFPDHPYLALIEPDLIGRGLRIVSATTGLAFALEELELAVRKDGDTKLAIYCSTGDGEAFSMALDVRGTVSGADDWVVVIPAGDSIGLAEFFASNPLTIFYPTGASSMGSVLFQPRSEYPPLPDGLVYGWTFSGVDIRAEHKGSRDGLQTVKSFTVDKLSNGAQFIIDDDRAGEVADLIVIEPPRADGSYAITLTHLKASASETPGARVDDLYELLGQASRSVVWCDGSRLAERIRARLGTGSSVARGNEADLDALLDVWRTNPPPIRWSIAIVQPGLRASQTSSSTNVKTMLNDLLEWVTQHGVELRAWVHE
jgi:superfamily II DNA or RNA helicase